MLIFGQDRELAAWAAHRLGISDFRHPYVAIGVARHGELMAVAIYNNYQHPNIEITFVTSTPRWATRQAISSIFRYPFVQLKCRRLTAITEATNEDAGTFLVRLGFKQEGYHPQLFNAADGVSYGLLAQDAARWIAEEIPHAAHHS
jgi:RimJ/RimL family protein N-acetyltransferase